jgi:tRNA (guanosine-2'-O-)-methyltransferase
LLFCHFCEFWCKINFFPENKAITPHFFTFRSPIMKENMEMTADTDPVIKQKLLDFLLTFISSNKKSKFEEKIEFRTRHLTIVLEDIYQPHNASAVLRSCDCFGIQDVHIIENMNKYEVNPDVALGSSKWLSLIKHNGEKENTASCLRELKKNGYRIVATTPHKDDFTPETLPLDQKIALVFGTELEGLTDTALGMADSFVRIPMYGFTESLNISVSAALLLFTLSERIRKSDVEWNLPPGERTGVLLQWARNSIKRSSSIEKEFFRKIGNAEI